MLELICQQRYRAGGVPIDISPYRNHGQAIDTSVEAGTTGNAIGFPNSDSRVQIDLGASGAWAPLAALKIELDVFVDTQAARTQFLLEGDGAFQMAVDEFALSGWILGPGGSVQIRTAAEWTGGEFIRVPSGRWVTLGLYDDGYANLELSFDGKVIASATVDSGVGGVGAGGVAVGNLLSGGAPLHGAIDELRIWRADPRAIRREFLCRPFGDAAPCWEAIFRAIKALAATDPDQLKTIANTLGAQAFAVMHDLLLTSPDSQAAVNAANQQLIALWCKGDAAPDEIAAAMAALVQVMSDAGVKMPNETLAGRLLPLLQGALPGVTLDCDPWGQTFLTSIGQAMAGGAGAA